MPLFTRLLAGAAPLALAATAVHADVVISSGATQDMTCNAGVCAPTAMDAVLNVGDLETMLAAGNLEVTAHARHVPARDLQIESAISSSSPYSLTLQGSQVKIQKAISMQGAGGITVYANILTIEGPASMSGSGVLEISCTNAHIDGAVSTRGTSSLSIGARELTIDRPLSIQGSGAVDIFASDLLIGPRASVTFTDLSVSPTINNIQYTLVNSLPTLAAAIAANPSGNFALANPYDASADGTYSASPIPTNFLGSLEGLGNTISNISVNNNAGCCVGGLFQSISQASVADVRLKKVSVISVQGAAGLAYESFGAISGSSVTGSVSGGSEDIAGLVGDNYGNIGNSYSTATVSAGGTVNGINVGGLVGAEYGTTQGSFATGAVSGGNGSGNIGGLIGEDANVGNQNSPQNCYATGNVSGGSGLNVGGLIGIGDYGSGNLSAFSCYSTGAVSGGGGSTIGGLIGANNSFVRDNYWDTTTSGTNVGVGLGNASGVTGLTTTQLQAGLPTGFQPKIWHENAKINNGLPYLVANPPPK